MLVASGSKACSLEEKNLLHIYGGERGEKREERRAGGKEGRGREVGKKREGVREWSDGE